MFSIYASSSKSYSIACVTVCLYTHIQQHTTTVSATKFCMQSNQYANTQFLYTLSYILLSTEQWKPARSKGVVVEVMMAARKRTDMWITALVFTLPITGMFSNHKPYITVTVASTH
jgi:hypothetical protein